MLQEENQVNNMENEMTPDEAAAALAFSTNLSEGMMPKMAPQETEMPPGEKDTIDMEREETEEETADPEAMKEEIKEDMKKEMRSIIKDELKKLLDDEDETTETSK